MTAQQRQKFAKTHKDFSYLQTDSEFLDLAANQLTWEEHLNDSTIKDSSENLDVDFTF